jgi:hypothetical protein
MTDPDHTDRAERHMLTEQDLAIAALVGRYVERREQAAAPRIHDLLALAAEFGDAVVDELLTVLAFYEAMRASDGPTCDAAAVNRHSQHEEVPMWSDHMKRGADSLEPMSPAESSPVVEEVLRFEDLPPGSRGTRRALVRWSDGSEGEALTWYADEILICEGDLVGKTREQLRSQHFRRDRDWLQS